MKLFIGNEHFFLHVFRMADALETRENRENKRLDIREVKNMNFWNGLYGK